MGDGLARNAVYGTSDGERAEGSSPRLGGACVEQPSMLDEHELSPPSRRILLCASRRFAAKSSIIPTCTTPLTPPRSPTRRSIPSCARLRELEAAHPACRPTSPTQRVGGYVGEQFAPVRHARRMYSLDNAMDLAELDAWLARIEEACGSVPPMLLRVEDRRLVHRAHLRGRGSRACGDPRRRHHRRDVTANVRTVKRRPASLACRGSFRRARGSIELRGEVYMPKSSFNALNEAARESGRAPFANPQRGRRLASTEGSAHHRHARLVDVYVRHRG